MKMIKKQDALISILIIISAIGWGFANLEKNKNREHKKACVQHLATKGKKMQGHVEYHFYYADGKIVKATSEFPDPITPGNRIKMKIATYPEKIGE